MEVWQAVAKLKGTLVVSCQASEGEPLCSPEHIKAMALSVIAGGAHGLRLEGKENIRAVRAVTKLPIIGLSKWKNLSEEERLSSVYITTTFDEAKELAEAGADIIAVDATLRPRPNGETLAGLVQKIHAVLKLPVMADISQLEEAKNAASLGVDLISTTLFGYTKETASTLEPGPALHLLAEIRNHIDVPAVLEGRVWQPHEVASAFQLGAYAVVVGSAITRPQLITARFARAIPRS
ncbi:MAG: N-acetylmannosamine-6-phosphate 2-epimerase [Candidatus Melainabacteria bacterium]|nr:MAG: N-acetylmannosamine-6-phosphate 2-epimerase [Candidatus Melainabacteria bacterium]